MNDKIVITFPDGNKKNFDKGITGYDVAYGISPALAEQALAVSLNDKVCDLYLPINENVSISILKRSAEESLELIRHDCAHVMAEAVQKLFPETQVTIGPAIENGFYYDFSRKKPFTVDDLEVIENKMHEIIDADTSFIREVWDRGKAIKHFSNIGEQYKAEIIKELPESEEVTVYKQGDWMDLCRGPHLPSTKHVGKSFKLMKVAGAYWRGDENNEMLTRIYGTAWRNDKELRTYLNMLKEAEKRDHRKIGKEMKLFTFDEEVGPGLPLWLPNGSVLIEELERLAKETEQKAGYDRVKTPHITKGSLYEKSGHLSHYKDSMFPAMDIDGNEYYLKPMNCPHHHKIYASLPRTYKDLPIRLSEYGTCYRYEKSGQLFGLMRVRSMQMNDAHIYCSEDQFKEEFLAVCKMYLKYFDIFGIEKYEMRLSLHDKDKLGEKYVNESELWIKTENLVREALEDGGLNFVEIPGEAAFYGPKIDVQVWSAIGREFTLATNQVDFAIPSKFDLTYIDKNNASQTPLCIHRAPLGTHERFIGFLIEHFAGNFPLWLSPMQMIVIPISDKFNDYAVSICNKLKDNDFRVRIDSRSEKMGAKIRDAEIDRIPIMIIVGENEVNSNTISIRRKFKGNLGSLSIEDFVDQTNQEIKTRSFTVKNS
ncbi:MAG: threonine--tRNA ligase [Candidatus Marinimicrobia bacterium]|nr:threonine--tRNA ligase [Candidatus Neomarinimicrobiota bacterium]|tara:strand:- start:8708 stop:10666 length:1959 start_codon:yes stop_codon:yes gene_type:complete